MTQLSSSISRLPVPDASEVDASVADFFGQAEQDTGFVLNFFRAFALNGPRMLGVISYLEQLLDAEAGVLSPRERELIAVVVSAENRCNYCIVTHSAALLAHSEDLALVRLVGINYRQAGLGAGERALADLAIKVTRDSAAISSEDLEQVRAAGYSDQQVLEAVEVASIFNFTNRLTSAIGLEPDDQFLRVPLGAD